MDQASKGVSSWGLIAMLEDFKVLRDGVPAAVQVGAEIVIFDGIESNPLLTRICLMSLGS